MLSWIVTLKHILQLSRLNGWANIDDESTRIAAMHMMLIYTCECREHTIKLNTIALEYPTLFTSSTPTVERWYQAHHKYDFTFYDKFNRIRFGVTADNKIVADVGKGIFSLSSYRYWKSIQLYIYLRVLYFITSSQIFDKGARK